MLLRDADYIQKARTWIECSNEMGGTEPFNEFRRVIEVGIVGLACERATEEDMAAAANRIVENRGGITVMDGGQVLGEVALPIAGIMSDDSLVTVNTALEDAKDEAFRLGVSRGIDPFMTLSFMALPVIPSLRLTTRGVFDVLTQRYV